MTPDLIISKVTYLKVGSVHRCCLSNLSSCHRNTSACISARLPDYRVSIEGSNLELFIVHATK